MEPLVLIALGSLVAVVLLRLLVGGAPRPHERLGHERSYAAEAEVEEDDIAQMIEARNAIRRRRGLPEIGDQLVDQVLSERQPPR